MMALPVNIVNAVGSVRGGIARLFHYETELKPQVSVAAGRPLRETGCKWEPL